MNKLELLTDQALFEDGSNAKDGLGFDVYASVLSKAAIGTSGPFTIGVFGEWGTGKTSLLRAIEDKLNAEPGVLTVWFNAWRYEKEEHPIVPLIATIIHNLELNKKFLSSLKNGGQSLIRALRSVAYGLSSKSKLKLPGFAEIEASFVAKDMIEREKELTPDPLLERSLYYDAFDRLTKIKTDSKYKIVVIIDDLDRCFPDSAIKLLESIKLVLSQHGFVFILGVARKIIEGYLDHRYSIEYGLQELEGQAYLDKIVQLPFHIPPHQERVKDFSNSLLDRLPDNLRPVLKNTIPMLAKASGSNPRSTIRFVNNILIDSEINKALSAVNIVPEIPLEYFAITRCLQQRWYKIFLILSSSQKICESVVEWKIKDIRSNITSDDPDVESVAKTLLTNEELVALFKTNQGRSWLINHDIRSATINFLKTQRKQSEDDSVSDYGYDVYLSYSNTDKEHVAKVSEFLTKQKIRVFFDTQIKPGEDFQSQVGSAMSNSKLVVLFLGSDALSKWQNSELDLFNHLGLSNKPKMILVLLPGSDVIDINKIPIDIARLPMVNLTKGITEERLLMLLSAINHWN